MWPSKTSLYRGHQKSEYDFNLTYDPLVWVKIRNNDIKKLLGLTLLFQEMFRSTYVRNLLSWWMKTFQRTIQWEKLGIGKFLLKKRPIWSRKYLLIRGTESSHNLDAIAIGRKLRQINLHIHRLSFVSFMYIYGYMPFIIVDCGPIYETFLYDRMPK